MLIRLLENYPFKNIGVTIAEVFLPYSGIDYVLKKSGEFAGFEVFTMFEGDVEFGVSNLWGKYFIVSKTIGEYRYDCVYAQLDNINEDLQKYAIIKGDRDFLVPGKYFLGWASGNTKTMRRLHIELFQKNLRTGERKKLNPYGTQMTGNKCPQPRESLEGFDHFWNSDEPEFV